MYNKYVSIFWSVFINKTQLTAMSSASFTATNSFLYKLTPNHLQQAIEDSVAGLIWTGEY